MTDDILVKKVPKSCQQWELRFLLTMDFRATKSCQQWEFTFLLTVALKATKTMSTVGVDISVDYSFQSHQNSVNSGS